MRKPNLSHYGSTRKFAKSISLVGVATDTKQLFRAEEKSGFCNRRVSTPMAVTLLYGRHVRSIATLVLHQRANSSPASRRSRTGTPTRRSSDDRLPPKRTPFWDQVARAVLPRTRLLLVDRDERTMTLASPTNLQTAPKVVSWLVPFRQFWLVQKRRCVTTSHFLR